jgi:hypothetical protein
VACTVDRTVLAMTALPFVQQWLQLQQSLDDTNKVARCGMSCGAPRQSDKRRSIMHDTSQLQDGSNQRLFLAHCK